jgi:SOS response regulatory protein OraA/RecX
METEIRKKLLNKAGDFLARRACSRGEMRAKLSKYADPPDVEATLDHLESVNLLNDSDYAYNFASSRVRLQGWGPIKVRHALLRRQVAPQIVEGAVNRVRRETGDEDALQAYLNRRCRRDGLPGDRKALQKLIAHLRRRGFADAIIYSALRRAVPDAVWETFETGE